MLYLKKAFFQSLVLDISTEKRAFMLSILSLPCAPVSFETVTALGFFDGVHRGHRALLDATVRLASSLGVKPAVFTFSGTFKGKAPLTDESTRLRLLEEAGIEAVFLVDFDAVRSLSPEDFVKNCLQGVCRARAAVCGFNFRFGKNASATAENLLSLLPSSLIIPAIYESGEVISSSRIRALLKAGAVEEAALLLGRPYSLTGEVLRGKALGKTWGFPTANMKPRALLPAPAVYATEIFIGEKRYPAITDVGTRPTVEGAGETRMETHIPAFSGDLYGKTLSVSFIKRLRDEKKFPSAEALCAQLTLDVAALNTIFDDTEKGKNNQ